MKFRSLACRLMLLVATVMSTTAGAEPGVSDTSIVVGTSVVTSGPLGALGTGIRDGAAVYFEQVNRRGGVAGRKIKLYWHGGLL